MNAVNPLKTQFDKDAFVACLKRYHEKYTILYLIGVETGLRISDILRIRAADVSAGIFTVTEQKTKKKRTIDLLSPGLAGLHAVLVSFIERFALKPEEFLIFSHAKRKTKSLSRIQAYRILRAAGASCGLMGIGTHTLRKTFARTHYKANGDLAALQAILNHKYALTTMAYLVSADDFKRLL